MIEQINKQGTVNGQTFTRATITPAGTDKAFNRRIKVYDLAFFDGGDQPVAAFQRLDRQTIDALKL